jgi:hypothetical protein
VYQKQISTYKLTALFKWGTSISGGLDLKKWGTLELGGEKSGERSKRGEPY